MATTVTHSLGFSKTCGCLFDESNGARAVLRFVVQPFSSVTAEAAHTKTGVAVGSVSLRPIDKTRIIPVGYSDGNRNRQKRKVVPNE